MGTHLDSVTMWALADMLGMTIEVDSANGVHGSVTKTVFFGDLQVPVPVTIVSSWLGGNTAVVIAKVKGSLGLMAWSSVDTAQIAALDLSTLPKAGEALLEKAKSADQCHALVAHAMVASYAKRPLSKSYKRIV